MLRLNSTLRLTKTELLVFRLITGVPYALPKTVTEYNAALAAAAARLEKGETLFERQKAVVAREMILPA
jgi:hypothetical protein